MTYSNSARAGAVLAPLTDIFALPTWLPFTNIFSIGDLLIGVGVVVVIVTAMRRVARRRSRLPPARRRRWLDARCIAEPPPTEYPA